MTKERSPVLPNLPTTGEQGLDVQAYTWSALFLPKGAPADVVKKLNEAAVGAINTPAVRAAPAAQLGVTLPKKEEQTPGMARPVPRQRDQEVGSADQSQRRQR